MYHMSQIYVLDMPDEILKKNLITPSCRESLIYLDLESWMADWWFGFRSTHETNQFLPSLSGIKQWCKPSGNFRCLSALALRARADKHLKFPLGWHHCLTPSREGQNLCLSARWRPKNLVLTFDKSSENKSPHLFQRWQWNIFKTKNSVSSDKWSQDRSRSSIKVTQ